MCCSKVRAAYVRPSFLLVLLRVLNIPTYLTIQVCNFCHVSYIISVMAGIWGNIFLTQLDPHAAAGPQSLVLLFLAVIEVLASVTTVTHASALCLVIFVLVESVA